MLESVLPGWRKTRPTVSSRINSKNSAKLSERDRETSPRTPLARPNSSRAFNFSRVFDRHPNSGHYYHTVERTIYEYLTRPWWSFSLSLSLVPFRAGQMKFFLSRNPVTSGTLPACFVPLGLPSCYGLSHYNSEHARSVVRTSSREMEECKTSDTWAESLAGYCQETNMS